jgi:ATP-binding cassette subfamily F protein uup
VSLNSLPAEIEALEKEQAEINASLADGSLFISDADKAMTNRLD